MISLIIARRLQLGGSGQKSIQAILLLGPLLRDTLTFLTPHSAIFTHNPPILLVGMTVHCYGCHHTSVMLGIAGIAVIAVVLVLDSIVIHYLLGT